MSVVESEKTTVAARLLAILTKELDKKENKHRLHTGIIRPLLEHVESCFKGYLQAIIVLLTVLLLVNGYIVYKNLSINNVS